jgi:hypothetical protein
MNSKRKCKQCGEYHDAATGVKVPLGWFCSHSHAVEFAMEKSAKQRERQAAKLRREALAAEKQASAQRRERKRAIAPLKYWRERAVRACHAYIHARDASKPCACCGATSAAQWDASHYRPAGVNSALKFDERNIHLCCQVCNQHKSGNLTAFRLFMVERYGEELVTEFDNNHKITRRTREELQAIEAEYKQKLNELKDKGQ